MSMGTLVIDILKNMYICINKFLNNCKIVEKLVKGTWSYLKNMHTFVYFYFSIPTSNKKQQKLSQNLKCLFLIKDFKNFLQQTNTFFLYTLIL